MSNMVHGPCGSINPQFPCMQNGLCSKKYPKHFMSESQLGSDSYLLYKRSSPDDGGQVSTISMRVGGIRIEQQVDNRWIVLYNKLLLQSMNCHCNLELCMSIKAIKYVLKYSMYIKGVTRLCSLYSPAEWKKSRTIRMLGMLAAMRQSGGYLNSQSMKGIPQCNNLRYT